jgi:hypothetical protein
MMLVAKWNRLVKGDIDLCVERRPRKLTEPKTDDERSGDGEYQR